MIKMLGGIAKGLIKGATVTVVEVGTAVRDGLDDIKTTISNEKKMYDDYQSFRKYQEHISKKE